MKTRFLFSMSFVVLFFLSLPVAAQDDILMEDKFSDNRNRWIEDETTGITRKIRDGVYYIKNKDDSVCWHSSIAVEQLDQLRDFEIEASVKILDGKGNYGITWGGQGIKYYHEFRFSTNGRQGRYYQRIDGTGYDILVDDVKPIKGNTKILRIKKAENDLTFYVNGQQFSRAAAFEPFWGNNLGFSICGAVAVEIDNLLVRQSTLQTAPTPTSAPTATPTPVKPTPTPIPMKPTPTPTPALKLHAPTPVIQAAATPLITPTPIPLPSKPIVNEKRVALVIGNNQYEKVPLKNPVHDAEDMSRALTALGFNVLTKTNVNQREMEEAIHQFYQSIQNGEVALFYFSGHGAQVNGENYLIPINENIQTGSDIRYKAVNAQYVLAKMEEANNQTNIIILDACRNNPFKGFKSQQQGFAPMIANRGTFIAYATSPGAVALEDPSARNSFYTKHLLIALQKRGLMIEQVFKEVVRGVENDTDQQQTPWIASSLRGDFYFNP